MSDDYEPAITETATDETGAESTITTRTPEAKIEPVLQAGEQGDNPDQPPGRDPRPQRQISDKTKAMLREIARLASKSDDGGVSGIADDLVPMGAEDTVPTATPVEPAKVAPPTAPPVVSRPDLPLPLPLPPLPAPKPAPVPQVDPAKVAALEAKEKALAEREQGLAAKEKLLPDINALIEQPGATLVAWLKQVMSVTSDEETKQLIADVTAELSETALETKLPSEFKTGMEARKANRTVKARLGEIGKAQQALTEQRVAAEKAAADAKAKADTEALEASRLTRVQEMISPAKDSYPFLHDTRATGGIQANVVVLSIIEHQDKLARQWLEENPGYQLPNEMKPNLETAMKIGDDFYRKKAEKLIEEAEALKPKVKPAVTQASPGKAVPGPAAKPVVAAAAKPVAVGDDDEIKVDRRDRRAADAKALFRKHFKNQATQ